MASLTPNSDRLFINLKAPRLSVEYAKARDAIHEDYKLLYASNQAMAQRVRKDWKHKVVDHMGGKVSWTEKELKNGKKDRYLIVTFPDHSVSRL